MTEQMSELSLRPLDLNEGVRPGSMEHMAAMVSDNENLASQGINVLLVHAQNNGGSHRWSRLEALGDEMVNELAESDIAYRLIGDDEFGPIYEQLDRDLVDDSLVTVELRLYKLGELVGRYSNELL